MNKQRIKKSNENRLILEAIYELGNASLDRMEAAQKSNESASADHYRDKTIECYELEAKLREQAGHDKVTIDHLREMANNLKS